MPDASLHSLAEFGRQIGFISAFLGGVAAAMLGTMLTLKSDRRIVGATAVCAAAAAAAFILAVVVSPTLVMAEGGSAPRGLAEARTIATLAHLAGLGLLLACIGMAGWVRSRAVGIATSLAAGAAAVLAVLSAMA